MRAPSGPLRRQRAFPRPVHKAEDRRRTQASRLAEVFHIPIWSRTTPSVTWMVGHGFGRSRVGGDADRRQVHPIPAASNPGCALRRPDRNSRRESNGSRREPVSRKRRRQYCWRSEPPGDMLAHLDAAGVGADAKDQTLAKAQFLAGHSSPATTEFCDRRQKKVTRNVVASIAI